MDRLYSVESELTQVVPVHHAHLVHLGLTTASHLVWHLEVSLVPLVGLELPPGRLHEVGSRRVLPPLNELSAFLLLLELLVIDGSI